MLFHLGIFFGRAPLWEAFSTSDIFGKSIFIALFFLSAFSWVLILYKLWETYMVRKVSQLFRENIQESNEIFSLQKFSPACPQEIENSFLKIYYRMRQQTLETLNKNKEAFQQMHTHQESEGQVHLSSADIASIETQVYAVVLEQKKKLDKNLFVLSTISSLSPFLGLLGTVWGILLTFGDLQARSSGGASHVALSGLSMALATTVLGLVVAIPALVSYNYLSQKVRDFEAEMEEFANEMLCMIEMLYRKVDVR